ncbi:hypothetical protein [Vulcanisaeta souniana]|uniref:hypothetical protein n=1 Tax=Vulcanisaeta souniana TaxID=164452 RepID=UPI000AFF3939|nr:hypothetical protein [Vulcanisaeta souniana]
MKLINLLIQAMPLVIIGRSEVINVTLIDEPATPIPINMTLQGCSNESMTVMGNYSLTLSFNNECRLVVTAKSYTLSAINVSYWDYLNLWLGNVIAYYNKMPLILNGTVTAYATFLNGTRIQCLC